MIKKKILIAGGTGFIGYHAAKKFLELGYEVTSLSTKKPKKERFLKKVIYLICDLTKKKHLSKKINKDYKIVINLSGHVEHNKKKQTYRSHYLGCKNLSNFFF